MIIQVDKEGKNVIEQFCDIVLKLPGMPLQNLNQVNLVLSTMVLISKPMPTPTLPVQPKQPEQPEQMKQPEQKV